MAIFTELSVSNGRTVLEVEKPGGKSGGGIVILNRPFIDVEAEPDLLAMLKRQPSPHNS